MVLFAKKRVHYLTITFADSTRTEQAAVLELGKDIVRTTSNILEVRTGKEIEFKDVDAEASRTENSEGSTQRPSLPLLTYKR